MLKTVGNPSTRYGNQTIIDGNIVIGTAGKGIDFSANSSAPGMTSELLDDYEEGTWTPAFESASGSFGSITYAIQSGTYTKVGNLVYVTGQLQTDAVTAGTASGELFLGGLPFAAATFGPLAVSWSEEWGSGNNPNSVSVRGASLTNCRLFYRTTANGANTSLDSSMLQTGTAKNYVQFAGCYIVA